MISPKLNVVEVRVSIVEVQHFVNVFSLNTFFLRQLRLQRRLNRPFFIYVYTDHRRLVTFYRLSDKVYLLQQC